MADDEIQTLAPATESYGVTSAGNPVVPAATPTDSVLVTPLTQTEPGGFHLPPTATRLAASGSTAGSTATALGS